MIATEKQFIWSAFKICILDKWKSTKTPENRLYQCMNYFSSWLPFIASELTENLHLKQKLFERQSKGFAVIDSKQLSRTLNHFMQTAISSLQTA